MVRKVRAPVLSQSSRTGGGRRSTETPAVGPFRLIQSGGIVGGRRVWTLRPGDLGATAQRHLQEAPTKKSVPSSIIRDGLVYSFVLKGNRRVTFQETALPPSLRTLVARVTRRPFTELQDGGRPRSDRNPRRPPDREGDSAWV